MALHNISIYKIFFEQISENPKLSRYADDNFLIYHISSPFPSKVHAIRDELSIKVYFRSLAPGKNLFLSQEYAFDSLSRIHIGHTPFREPDNKGLSSMIYSGSLARCETFEFSQKTDFKGFITIDEARKHYGIYKALDQVIDDDMETSIIQELRNERLAFFQQGDKTILIPSIVILQAFYIKSPQNSLADAMRHPSGLASIVKRWVEKSNTTEGRQAFIELDGKSHIDDVDMIIYFMQDPDLTHLFNQIADQVREGLPVDVPIPKKEKIKFEAECFVTKNCTLVTNILSSNLIDDVVGGFSEIEVLHHKSYKWKPATKQGAKKPPTRRDSEAVEKLDDLGRPDGANKPLIVSTAGMNLESIGKSSFSKKILSMGERERQAPQNPPQNDIEPMPVTSRYSRGGSGKRKPIQNKKTSISSSKSPKIRIIEEELGKAGFNCNTESFLVPLPENKKTLPQFCFRDKQKIIQRNYYILKAVSMRPEIYSFYFVWLDPQNIDGKIWRKEMLVASMKSEDMEWICDIIYRELLDQAKHGNRKWFKGQSPPIQFRSFRYSDKFKDDPAKTILDEVSKLYSFN